MKEFVLVFSHKVARRLLKEGYTIADIKPFKENPEATIFIFKNEEGLMDAVNRVK